MTVLAVLLVTTLPVLWPQGLVDRVVFTEGTDGGFLDASASWTKGLSKESAAFDLSKPLTVSVWFRYPKPEGDPKAVYMLGVNGGRIPETGKFPLNNMQANVVPTGFGRKGFTGYYQAYNMPGNADLNRFITTEFLRDYPPEEWHHAAMVSIPSKTDYYLDGKCVGTAVHSAPIRPEWKVSRLNIGSAGSAFDEICVFDMALSAEIIAAYYADARSYLISRKR